MTRCWSRQFVNRQAEPTARLEPGFADGPGKHLRHRPAGYSLDIHTDPAATDQRGDCHHPTTV